MSKSDKSVLLAAPLTKAWAGIFLSFDDLKELFKIRSDCEDRFITYKGIEYLVLYSTDFSCRETCVNTIISFKRSSFSYMEISQEFTPEIYGNLAIELNKKISEISYLFNGSDFKYYTEGSYSYIVGDYLTFNHILSSLIMYYVDRDDYFTNLKDVKRTIKETITIDDNTAFYTAFGLYLYTNGIRFTDENYNYYNGISSFLQGNIWKFPTFFTKFCKDYNINTSNFFNYKINCNVSTLLKMIEMKGEEKYG